MTDVLAWHRIQFAFTITYHYLFPQLTMGLALLLVALKIMAIRKGDRRYDEVGPLLGTDIRPQFCDGRRHRHPARVSVRHQLGTVLEFRGGNHRPDAGDGGVFAFFLESTFLGLFLYGEKHLGPRGHLATAVALFVGSWLSGYFIIVTNAFMQHPVGYSIGDDGILHLADFWVYLFNPWAFWQYVHNMLASVVTASFVISAVSAYWSLMGKNVGHADDLSAAWSRRGSAFQRSGRLSSRRRAGETAGEAPASYARGDGGSV